MKTIESLNKARQATVNLIRVIEPLEGRFVSRLSSEDKTALSDAIQAADDAGAGIMPQHIQEYSRTGKPRIRSSKVKDLLADLEASIHTADTVDTLPSIDEYRAAFETFKALSSKVKDEAKAAGIPYGNLMRFIPVASFPAI